MWHRVFAAEGNDVPPAALLEHLHGAGYAVAGHFRGDDRGWFQAEFHDERTGHRCKLQRYLADEAGIRDDLNAWAAGVELLDSPHVPALMLHLATARQLFTLCVAPEGFDPEFCERLCRWLAMATAGIYQIDGRGFFAADGTLLAREDS